MKLKRLRIAGFRGFNSERIIDFHERLTLVSAPNSHGKTSITEALEFLIYGETSKVASASSKEEYKGSYRNRHYPDDLPALIEATFTDHKDEPVVLRVELDSAGSMQRFVNNAPVADWPFADKLGSTARPFVVQHALKNLLLVAPTERFQGFARLLGLNDVDVTQQAIVNLCTKPESSIPDRAKQALQDLQSLEERIAAIPELQVITKDFKHGPAQLGQVYKKVLARAENLLQKKIKPNDLLATIVAARDDAAAKVYSGNVALKAMNHTEQTQLSSLREKITNGIGTGFIDAYARLAARDATERLQKEANLLSLGMEFLKESSDTCPLCGQTLDEALKQHIQSRHDDLKSKFDAGGQDDPRTLVTQGISTLQTSVQEHSKLLEIRSNDLLAATANENQEKVRALFGKDNEASWEIVRSTATSVEPYLEELNNTESKVQELVTSCRDAVQAHAEEVGQAENLVRGAQQYLSATDAYHGKLDELTPMLVGPAHLFRQAIDATAGTTELSVLIEILEKKILIEKVLRIREALASLKDLKKHVDQTVGEIMEAAFGSDLTGSVMSWYAKIRTSGDPDVHFSGFAMEKTKTGDFKSRRVKVGATSYGVELASAVSSLSESKLNALGLCMSIATALRAPGPWDFLVLDDPIQSWDQDHETQFIEIIRSLVEQENKQVILLSHREQWIDQVSHGCRTINGIRFCITGYTQDGPHIATVNWATIDERLREIHSIMNDPKVLPVRLQQAEEEIRIAACQLVAVIAKKKLGRDTSPHNMNSKDVRSILNEAGCTPLLVDRVFATFGTTDDAHHAPKDYQPNVERIRQYYGALVELKKWGAS